MGVCVISPCTVTVQWQRCAEGSAGVFKRLCACLPACPLWCVTYAWPPTTTQWLLRVHAHTCTICIKRSLLEWLENRSFSHGTHPPTHSPDKHIYIHYLVSRISPSPGWRGVAGFCPFPYARRHKTDTIRQRSPMTSPPTVTYSQTLYSRAWRRPTTSFFFHSIRVNSKYSAVRVQYDLR